MERKYSIFEIIAVGKSDENTSPKIIEKDLIIAANEREAELLFASKNSVVFSYHEVEIQTRPFV